MKLISPWKIIIKKSFSTKNIILSKVNLMFHIKKDVRFFDYLNY
jgi:hypothetical protein